MRERDASAGREPALTPTIRRSCVSASAPVRSRRTAASTRACRSSRRRDSRRPRTGPNARECRRAYAGRQPARVSLPRYRRVSTEGHPRAPRGRSRSLTATLSEAPAEPHPMAVVPLGDTPRRSVRALGGVMVVVVLIAAIGAAVAWQAGSGDGLEDGAFASAFRCPGTDGLQANVCVNAVSRGCQAGDHGRDARGPRGAARPGQAGPAPCVVARRQRRRPASPAR